MKITLYALIFLAGPAVSAIAQQPMGMHGSPDPATSPSSKAFKAANEKMMLGMTTPVTGNADRDFVAAMIPHHEGAVDMAKVELQYGKDPVLRQLAKSIITAQNKELLQMKAWQAKHN